MRLIGKFATSAGVLALSTGFAAAAPAVVQQDLNLRAGPGVDYQVIAAMPAGATVDVMGCEASWCRVDFAGTTGFASRGYLGLGGGVAVAPGYRSYAYGGYAPRHGYDEETYGYGSYRPRYGYGEETYGYGSYSPGYTYGEYGTTAYGGGYGYYGNQRRYGNERVYGSERSFGNESRVRRESSAAARASSQQRAAEIKGNNPMKDYKISEHPNLERNQRQATAIKGNNPMKEYKREPAAAHAQAPSAIKGNNPMKIGRSTASQQPGTAQAGNTRGHPRETTGAGREYR